MLERYRGRVDTPLQSTRISTDGVLEALFVIILSTSLLQQTLVPEVLYIISVVPATLLFGLVAVYTTPQLSIPKYGLAAYATIWLIYLPHALYPSLSTFALVRIPVFMTSSFILLFVIPQRIQVERLFVAIFYIALGLSVIGLLSFSTGDILGYPLTRPDAAGTIPLLGIQIDPLSSLLTNPNTLSKVTALGGLAGVALYQQRRNHRYLPLLFVVLLGLVATLSRASLFGFGIGLSVLITATYRDRRSPAILATAGIAGISYIAIAALGIVPDPFGVDALLKFSRVEFWSAALNRLASNFLFGIGFQPLEGVVGASNIHSAYMFVLLTRGSIGFVVHLFFFGLIFRQLLLAPLDTDSATLLAMFVFWLILMVISSAALFGFAVNAVWPSLIIGYSLMHTQEITG